MSADGIEVHGINRDKHMLLQTMVLFEEIFLGADGELRGFGIRDQDRFGQLREILLFCIDRAERLSYKKPEHWKIFAKALLPEEYKKFYQVLYEKVRGEYEEWRRQQVKEE